MEKEKNFINSQWKHISENRRQNFFELGTLI